MREQTRILRLAGAAIAMAALALPLRRAEGQQDTSGARAADTAAGQPSQGYRAMERDSSGDTSAATADTAVVRDSASSVQDSTRPGQTTPKTPSRSSRRIHPGSDTTSRVGGAALPAQGAGADTLGMPGRHGGDSTYPGQGGSPSAERPSDVRDQSTSGADSTQ
jgi:hypothetical protein